MIWHCHAAPPADPTCPATGTTDRSAEQHTKKSGHCTSTHVAVWAGKETA